MENIKYPLERGETLKTNLSELIDVIMEKWWCGEDFAWYTCLVETDGGKYDIEIGLDNNEFYVRIYDPDGDEYDADGFSFEEFSPAAAFDVMCEWIEDKIDDITDDLTEDDDECNQPTQGTTETFETVVIQ